MKVLSPKQRIAFRKIEKELKKGKFPYHLLEEMISVHYKEEGILEEYLNLKESINKFQITNESFLGENKFLKKIKLSLNGKENTILNEEELKIKKQIELAIEKQILIILILANGEIINKKEDCELNFYKYLISNFYRTLCEISPKLFYCYIKDILHYLEKKYSEEMNKPNSKEKLKERMDFLKECEKKVSRGSLDLSSLREIISRFESKTYGSEFLKQYNFYLGYHEGGENIEGGFVLRNAIAHENRLFSETDLKKELFPAMTRIQMFNTALIFSLYSDFLKEISSKFKFDENSFDSWKGFFDFARERF